jgi:hypothetical protein
MQNEQDSQDDDECANDQVENIVKVVAGCETIIQSYYQQQNQGDQQDGEESIVCA